MSRFAQLAKYLAHNPPIDTSAERAKAAHSLDQALADDLESIRYAAEEHAENSIASDVSTAAFEMIEAWLESVTKGGE